MTNLQKIYCDGAAMAYRDVAQKMREMESGAPESLKEIFSVLVPFAEVIERKADEVYKEAEMFKKLAEKAAGEA